MDANLLITLQNYGLSEKEARVYLTVLELGTSIASTIARRAELNRVTTYTILEDLKMDGIVNETIKEGVKYYSVISPDILLKQLEQKYESFKEKVPELLAMAEKFGSKPRVQFFEGLEGVKKMYNDLLTSTTEPICAFLGLESISTKLHEYLNKEFLPQRIKLGIKAKVISHTGEKNKAYKSMDKQTLKETRMIKDNAFILHHEINIYGEDRVAIAMFNHEEMSALIIHSKKFHDTLLSIFNFIWKTK
jgi:sugar-specific transcriptional regulator TrmB